MDLDNLGPVVLFIVYMAISAWSKHKKARQRAQPIVQKPMGREAAGQPPPAQKMVGILEQLKKELFELEEEPLPFEQELPEPESKIAREPILAEKEIEPAIIEGSSRRRKDQPVIQVKQLDNESQDLETILSSYSILEQAVILHEVLDRPRAYQTNDEWFHQS